MCYSKAGGRRQQPLGNVHSEVWVNTDQVRIEGSMVNFGQRNAIRNDWLSKHFVLV